MPCPTDMVWCGDDSVVLFWQGVGMVMIGPTGDWLTLYYKNKVHLIAEPDCCRIFTATSYDMLQRVPMCMEDIKRIGSTDPAALLYDAMEVCTISHLRSTSIAMVMMMMMTTTSILTQSPSLPLSIHILLTFHLLPSSHFQHRHSRKVTPEVMRIFDFWKIISVKPS